MFSSGINYTQLPQIPIPEIPHVDDALGLINANEQNALLTHLTDVTDQKINKKKLSTYDCPSHITVLIHNRELYVRHLEAGRGAFAVVKFIWNIRTHEWFVMKIVSEKNDGCTHANYKYKKDNIKSEFHALLKCNMVLGNLGSRLSPRKGQQHYFVMKVKYGMELFYYNRNIIRTKSHPHHTLSRYAQLCRLVHELHRRRILHRDLKTENLMLDISRNQLDLVDFGYAKVLSENENAITETMLIGTPYNLAPELFWRDPLKNYPYSFLTDRFATGVIIGECERLTTLDDSEPAKLVPDRLRNSNHPLKQKVYALCANLMHDTPAQRMELNIAAEKFDALHAFVNSPVLLRIINLTDLFALENIDLDQIAMQLSLKCHEAAMMAPSDFKINAKLYQLMSKMLNAGIIVHDKIFHTDNPIDILAYLRDKEPHIKREAMQSFNLYPAAKRVEPKPAMEEVLESTSTVKPASTRKLSAQAFRQFKSASAPEKHQINRRQKGCNLL